MSEYHTPVLVNEVIEGLKVGKEKRYIDATAGGGGHTAEIIRRGGKVLAIDQDADAIDFILKNQKLEIKNQKLIVAKGNFRDIELIAKKNGFEQVDGVLFDLGVSSFQIDVSGRGFSFRKDEPLDMRMDNESEQNAFRVVNSYDDEALTQIFLRFGEEISGKRVAEAIINQRKEKKIETSQELAKIVESVIPKTGKVHPATRIFQAIRIEVNAELEALRVGLMSSLQLLGSEGRIVVISFHSLEDRIVKQLFRQFEFEGKGKVITHKPIISTEVEIKQNNRSRSAKLRVYEKS